jgi:uncharacterized protein YeaO (DUF488 family)
MSDNLLLDRNGNPVRIKRIPPRGAAKKLFKSKSFDNTVSPFERFKSSNEGKGKCTSF